MNRNALPTPNAKCKICGKPYYRCKRCIELHAAGVFSWKMHCDSYECFAVYDVLAGVRAGVMDKEQAREMLSERFSGGLIPEMLPGVAEEYAEIMEKPQKARRKRGQNLEIQSISIAIPADTDIEANSETPVGSDESEVGLGAEPNGESDEAI